MKTFADRSYAKAAGRTIPLGWGRERTQDRQGQASLPLGGLHFQDLSRLLPGSAPIVQTKSARVGPAGDAFEQEADRVSEEVTKSDASGTAHPPPRLSSGPGGVLRRHPSVQGSEMGSGMQTQLGEVGGGSSLPTSLRAKFEAKFGADFSGVRVHTGSRAEAMNRSLHARAFTTGQDIFFGKGEYQPDTPKGEKVLAHELTHVGQQNPGLLSKPLLSDQTGLIRPLRMNPKDAHYYSDAAPGLHAEYKADTPDDSFLTATSNDGRGGGHTTIFLEYFDQTNNTPVNKRVELFLGQSWGSISISIRDYTPGQMQEKLAGLGSGYKKTWKKTRANAMAALQAAQQIQTDQANYSYWKLGKGLPFTNNNMNCARFGQRVLQAGGVDLHINTLKLPKRITNPAVNNGAIANIYSTANLQTTARSQLPDYCRDPEEFLTASQVTANDRNALFLSTAAGQLKQYHMYEETPQRTPYFISAINQLTGYAKAAASAEYVDRRSDPTAAANPSLAWLRTNLYDALRREATRLSLELRSDIRALQQAGLPTTDLDPLVAQIHEAMRKLAALMRFSSADAMVRAKVMERFTNTRGNTNMNKVAQILGMGEAGGIAANFAL